MPVGLNGFATSRRSGNVKNGIAAYFREEPDGSTPQVQLDALLQAGFNIASDAADGFLIRHRLHASFLVASDNEPERFRLLHLYGAWCDSPGFWSMFGLSGHLEVVNVVNQQDGQSFAEEDASPIGEFCEPTCLEVCVATQQSPGVGMAVQGAEQSADGLSLQPSPVREPLIRPLF